MFPFTADPFEVLLLTGALAVDALLVVLEVLAAGLEAVLVDLVWGLAVDLLVVCLVLTVLLAGALCLVVLVVDLG